MFGAAGRWVRLAVFLVDYLVIGYDILGKAGKGIRNGQVFDEHFLMAVATLGALALAIYENGDYLEAIAVMLFYQVGEWFQSYAVGKSRRNISDLMDIRPDYANIERMANWNRWTRTKWGSAPLLWYSLAKKFLLTVWWFKVNRR